MSAPPAIELVNRSVQAINRQDWVELESILAPQFTRHSAAAGELVAFLKAEYRTFPDAREELPETFTDGTMDAARHRFRGTHLGPMGAPAPTGRVMESTRIALFRVTEGKIAEAWAEWDNLSGLRQLGLVPGFPHTTGVDMSSNLDLVRSLYQAFAVGDIPAVLGALSPAVHWTEAAGGPYGGVSIGPSAVLANVFMKIGTEWEGFAVVPKEFVAEGATVVALGEYSGTYKATGKSFTAPFAHVWKFDGNKATSFQQYTDTAVHMRPLQP